MLITDDVPQHLLTGFAADGAFELMLRNFHNNNSITSDLCRI
jgi:hypothetical protein